VFSATEVSFEALGVWRNTDHFCFEARFTIEAYTLISSAKKVEQN
jgi:hypothetical protein